MIRDAAAALALLLLGGAACSSWDTGTPAVDEAEQACKDTLEAYARAAERCGADFRTAYDAQLQASVAGDCRNVRSIRDPSALRAACIPFVNGLTCAELAAGKTDASCAHQLQRTASLTPRLAPPR
jgi:hypothetical protein